MSTVKAILGAVLVAAAALAVPSAAHADTTASPARILIIGDSVTQGKVGNYTWRYRLWNTLRADRVAVDFVGPHTGLYDGTSATPFDNPGYADPAFDQDHDARWGAAMAAFTDISGQTPAELAAAEAPDVVINDLGLNDLTWFGETPAQLLGEMGDFVTSVRSAAPHATIIFGELTQSSRAGVTEYNAGIESLAASLDQPGARVLAAPVAAGYSQAADTYDGTHPNADGEVKIAAQFSAVLLGLGLPTDPVPPAPTTYAGAAHLGAVARYHAARLTFTTPAGATGQAVWARDKTRAGRWHVVGHVAAAAHSFRVTRLHAGHRYAFRLRAYDGGLASSVPSNRVSVRVH